MRPAALYTWFYLLLFFQHVQEYFIFKKYLQKQCFLFVNNMLKIINSYSLEQQKAVCLLVLAVLNTKTYQNIKSVKCKVDPREKWDQMVLRTECRNKFGRSACHTFACKPLSSIPIEPRRISDQFAPLYLKVWSQIKVYGV